VDDAAVAALVGDDAAAAAEAAADVDAPAAPPSTTRMEWAEVVAVLLDAGAAVDAADNDGETPLHAAARHGRSGAVGDLLKAGACADGGGGRVSPLQAAAERQHLDVVRVLLAWGASVPAGVRPKRRAALKSSAALELLCVLHTTRRLNAAECQAAQDEWHAAAARRHARAVAAVDPTDDALVAVQAAFDGFVVNPASLTVAALMAALTPHPMRDVRCLLLAHQLLLFADRVGVFARGTPAEARARRSHFFSHVYQPVVRTLVGPDRAVVGALVQLAADGGLLE